jgi:NADPH:quinone reductase-like Zn-dependent oxidoreductase
MPQAVQFSEYGTNEVLQISEVQPPIPGAGQVRLAVRAAGAKSDRVENPAQELMPLEFPAGLGSDVAGVVEQVGPGVDGLAVGDEVLGTSSTPSYAEFALAESASLVRKPTAVPWAVAGSLAAAGGTAWTVLERLGISAGETLLIHAAAGGVGTFAAQLAVARGARVIGTASKGNHAYLRTIGVEPVAYGDGLADRVRSIAPHGVDAVLDASGRGEIPLSIELAGGPERVLTLVAFDAADTGIQVHLGGSNDVRSLDEILELIEQGKLQVPIFRTYPLSEAAAAIDASRTGRVRGKIVLEVN